MGKLSTTIPLRPPIVSLHRAAVFLLLILLHLQATAQSTVAATTIPLILPSAIVFDPQGNLYLAETANHVIRKVDTTGIITTIAGTGTQGFSGDSGPATAARLDSPQGLAFDPAGNLYIADTQNHRIRKIAATTGNITTIAGNGTQGFSGDAGPATSASIDSPTGLSVDTSSNVYLADTHNHRIRKITAIAGTSATGYNGDNTTATTATLALPHGLTIDPAGNLYLADTANHRIRRIDATTGIITTIAGASAQTFAGDTGPAPTASLDTPRAATTSPTGLLTLSDTGNQRVRQIATDNTLHTIAGLGLTTPLGTATLTTNSATLSTSTLPAGRHGIIATYAGDLTHPSAQSSTLSLTIAPQQITASITPAKLLYGQPIPVLNATLTGLLPQDASSLSATFTTTATTLSPAGTYPITATLTGPAAGNYTLTPSPANLTIAPAPTLTTLTASTDTVAPGLPLTLTTHVASTTSGTPTGTISLLDGATMLFTADVPATGDAAFTTSSLAQGVHSLTTLYTGDANFTPSTSAPQLIGIGTNPNPDFTLASAGTSTQTILSGGSATFTFAVQIQGTTLSSPINLAASGLPNLATASFNPSYLPPGATPNTFTLTITTPKTAALNNTPQNTPLGPSPALALLLLPIASLALRLRARKTARLLTFALLTTTLTLCSGCGEIG